MSNIPPTPPLRNCSDGTYGLTDPQLPIDERIRRLRRLRGLVRTLYGLAAHPAADAIHEALVQPDDPELIRNALEAIQLVGRPARRPAPQEVRP